MLWDPAMACLPMEGVWTPKFVLCSATRENKSSMLASYFGGVLAWAANGRRTIYSMGKDLPRRMSQLRIFAFSWALVEAFVV